MLPHVSQVVIADNRYIVIDILIILVALPGSSVLPHDRNAADTAELPRRQKNTVFRLKRGHGQDEHCTGRDFGCRLLPQSQPIGHRSLEMAQYIIILWFDLPAISKER